MNERLSADDVREFVLSVSNTWHIAVAVAASDRTHVETQCHRLVKPKEWAEGTYVPLRRDPDGKGFPSHFGARGSRTRSVCTECGFYQIDGTGVER